VDGQLGSNIPELLLTVLMNTASVKTNENLMGRFKKMKDASSFWSPGETFYRNFVYRRGRQREKQKNTERERQKEKPVHGDTLNVRTALGPNPRVTERSTQ